MGTWNTSMTKANRTRFNRAVLLIALTLFAATPDVVSAGDATRIDDNGRQPQAAVSADGRVYIAYAKDGAIYCVASRDGGKTFAAPVKVGEPKKMPVGMRRGPRVTATEDAVVITAISGELGGGKDGDVVAWRSEDGGATWNPLGKPLNTTAAAAREGLHGMAAGPGGQVFCVWLDLRNAGRGSGMEVWGARSEDSGRTWSRDFLVYRSPEKSVCQCCHPSVAYGPDGKTVAVMFRNELSGNRDMYLVQSRNGGKMFGKAQKLGIGTWTLNACPMDGGMLVYPADGDAARNAAGPLTAWRRESRVFSAEPGQRERELAGGQQPWVASGPGGSYVVWITGRPGDLMLAEGDGPPVKVADGASDPCIAAAPGAKGDVVIVWEGGGGVMAKRLARGE